MPTLLIIVVLFLLSRRRRVLRLPPALIPQIEKGAEAFYAIVDSVTNAARAKAPMNTLAELENINIVDETRRPEEGVFGAQTMARQVLPSESPRDGIVPDIGGVSEAMLRASEAMREDAVLVDPDGEHIHAPAHYDFRSHFGDPQSSLAARAAEIDRALRMTSDITAGHTTKNASGHSPLRRVRWSSRQLEIFLAVVDEKGFSAAGERLHMVQPAVSLAIRKIEEAAGVRLLDRSSGQGVIPTDEGLLFLSYARAISRQMDELAVQLNDLRSLNAGHIVLGAPPVTMEFVLSALASDFLAQHPGLTFGATAGSDETTMARVRTGEIDIGFVPGPVIADDLELREILRQPLACCVPEASPLAAQPEIAWRDILSFPLALFPRGYNQRAQIDEIANQMGLRPNVLVESESSGFLLEMVRAGHALSITFAGVGRAIKGISVMPIETRPSVQISICRRTDGYISTAATSFYDYVVGRISDSAAR